MGVTFRGNPDTPGITFLDQVSDRQLRIETSDPVQCEAVAVPPAVVADVAVALQCRELQLPELPSGHIRGSDGSIRHTVPSNTTIELGSGKHVLELHLSMKLYVILQGPGQVFTDDGRLHVRLPHESGITAAVRSYAENPRERITTTERISDLLAALSHLGHGLQTLTVERSYPTLRSYPPVIELGEELSIPDSVDPPASGVNLVVPPDVASVYASAPVAYYLGATCIEGEEGRLVTDDGFEYELGTGRRLVGSLERVLKQCFLCDTVVRTEGFYELDLAVREAIEPMLDTDLRTLYDAPLSRRLESYLKPPFSDIAPYLPRWGLTADVPSHPSSVDLVSHLAYRLAIVRPAEYATKLTPQVARRRLLQRRFLDGPTRGEERAEPGIIEPADTDAIEHVWFGDGLPLGATLGVDGMYDRRQHSGENTGEIDVAVVLNGDIGSDEDESLSGAYCGSEYLPWSIERHRNLGIEGFRHLLETSCDFLHYIGHVDGEGFRCEDGHLDATEMDSVGPKTFLLNACNSYEQGVALVEAGSTGGVVTFGDVLDREAGQLGDTMARLLRRGFPLSPAHEIAREHVPIGVQYLVVGDGTCDLAQAPHGAPVLCAVEAVDGATDYDATFNAYLPQELGMGILALPYLGEQSYYLPPGNLCTVRVSLDELREAMAQLNGPVLLEDTLRWDADDIPADT